MASVFSTEGLAERSANRRWIVVAIFVVILAVAGFVSGAYPLTTTTEVKLLNNPESGRADKLLTSSGLRGPRPAFETIIVHSEEFTVDQPMYQQVVTIITATMKGKTELVVPGSVFNYYNAVQFGNPAAEGLVSADRHTTIIPVQMAGNVDDAIDHAPDYLEAVEGITLPAGFEVISVGDASVNHEINEITEKDAIRGERIGVPLALIVLIIVLGALVAAVLPIVLAIVSILISLGIISLASQQFELSFIVFNMVTMIGLAVGIDYTLFVIDRYREERRRGHDKRGAIVGAAATAVRAVFFSGTTVVLALLGLFLVPNNIFRSLSLGAIVVVVIAVLATMTLIPAVLMLLGDKINWPRHRDYVAEAAAQATHDHETYHKGFWGRTTKLVMSHPWVSVIGSVAILLALSYPLLDMKSGLTGVSSLPEGTVAREGLMILQRDFAAGLVAPVEFVVDGTKDDPAVTAAIDSLYASLAADPAFTADPPVSADTAPAQWDEAGTTALIQVPLNVAPDSQTAFEAIDRVRGQLNGPVNILVTGQSAINVDFFAMKDFYTPIVFIFVLGLSFIVLMMAFRSIVVPLKAIIMNLLSVGSAYGLIVLVFQKGIGDELFGFQRVDAIEAWLPLFLFCVLFGLSMDYHVFLLSRIREHYSLTGDNAASVAVGLQATAKLITGAALIMVFVFSGFAAGRLVPLQQLGFGMAVSVALDATLIRMILVPASMELLGDRNWYFPSWLSWLPHISIEGKAAPVPAATAPTLAPSMSADD
jgi:putative drug exporter of the RND superfamily